MCWSWTDRRARLLLLPAFVLQLAYILVGEPRHGTAWHVLGVYMNVSIGTWVVLRLRDGVRRRRTARDA